MEPPVIAFVAAAAASSVQGDSLPAERVWQPRAIGHAAMRLRVLLCTGGSCAPAQALKGQRYLSADAPRLPVADCTSPEACRCVYRKHEDRRAGPRREAEASGLKRSSPDPERRRASGRRRGDQGS